LELIDFRFNPISDAIQKICNLDTLSETLALATGAGFAQPRSATRTEKVSEKPSIVAALGL
jgi:hypothetical protein